MEVNRESAYRRGLMVIATQRAKYNIAAGAVPISCGPGTLAWGVPLTDAEHRRSREIIIAYGAAAIQLEAAIA